LRTSFHPAPLWRLFPADLQSPNEAEILLRGREMENILFSTARPLFFKISATVTTVAIAAR
jgi:hypothetical protein